MSPFFLAVTNWFADSFSVRWARVGGILLCFNNSMHVSLLQSQTAISITKLEIQLRFEIQLYTFVWAIMSKAADKAPFPHPNIHLPEPSRSILSRYATPIYPPWDIKIAENIYWNQERMRMPDPVRDNFLGGRVSNIPCLGSSGVHEKHISILVSYS